MRRLHVVLPGPIIRKTGGTIYDRKVTERLPALGWKVVLHELAGAFPVPDAAAEIAIRDALASIPAGEALLIDGLALPAMMTPMSAGERRDFAVMCHHPVALETGWDTDTQAWLEGAERAAFPNARLVISPSHRTLEDLADMGIAFACSAVAAPGSDPIGAAIPVRTFPENRPARLLCVANLMPRKGHDILLEALAGLGDLSWRLDCVGAADPDSEWPAALAARCEVHGIGSRVQFCGALDNAALAAKYRSADLFVLASRHEGYGMVFAEAVRWQLPVIAADSGAVREAAPDGATRFVPSGDPEALAAALRDVLSNRDEYDRLAAGSRTAAGSLPEWDDTAAAVHAALAEVWPCRSATP